jgi:hypothetical protein
MLRGVSDRLLPDIHKLHEFMHGFNNTSLAVLLTSIQHRAKTVAQRAFGVVLSPDVCVAPCLVEQG